MSTELPFTLGHEVAGTVAALSDGMDGMNGGESDFVYGVGRQTLPFRFDVIPFETPVVLSNWGARAELAQVDGLAYAGALQPSSSMLTTSAAVSWPLGQGRTRDEPD